MATAREHHFAHVAPIYLWMAGGIEHALRLGTLDVASLGLPARHDDLAVDLGAGFGMHAIPLARMGYSVIAIDSSPELIDELGIHACGLPIRPIVADLVDFRMHVPGRAARILCMGDTLTHLDSQDSIKRLFADVAACLLPGGRFVATFRDYTRLPAGDAVPEYDIVHERHGDARTLEASTCPKLRLDPDWVGGELRRHGLVVERSAGPRGMVGLTAVRGGT